MNGKIEEISVLANSIKQTGLCFFFSSFFFLVIMPLKSKNDSVRKRVYLRGYMVFNDRDPSGVPTSM